MFESANQNTMDTIAQQINWHYETLPGQTKKALDFLSEEKWLKESRWYLAGGTALALQAGHRRSVDLDFFTSASDFSTVSVLKHLSSRQWKTVITEEGTIHGTFAGAKASFLANPHFIPGFSFRSFGTIRLLDERDVATTKVISISQRGKKRDFLDLYWYVTHREPLETVLRRLPKQYPSVAHDYHHLLKALVYFADAESDPMPDVLFPCSWKKVKQYFEKETMDLVPKLLKIL